MRIAVLSDIHSNLAALEAVLTAVGSVDAIWQLGDVVGYGPDPDRVVERLVREGALGVRGNHDAAAVGGDEIEYFNPDARRAAEWTRRTITPGTAEYLAALPERLIVGEFTLVHGSPRAPIWEYVTSPLVAAPNLDAITTRICLHGHTHVPIAFAVAVDGGDRGATGASAGQADGGGAGPGDATAAPGRIETVIPSADGASVELEGARALLNPGSVGQPRDGDPRASFLVLDTEAGLATWRRVEYDIRRTQEAMRAVDLPPRLVERLRVGL